MVVLRTYFIYYLNYINKPLKCLKPDFKIISLNCAFRSENRYNFNGNYPIISNETTIETKYNSQSFNQSCSNKLFDFKNFQF